MPTPTTFPTPRLGRGPAAEGRRAALRSFSSQVLTLDGDIHADIARVESGNAPVEFKQAFIDALHALSAALDADTNQNSEN